LSRGCAYLIGIGTRPHEVAELLSLTMIKLCALFLMVACGTSPPVAAPTCPTCPTCPAPTPPTESKSPEATDEMKAVVPAGVDYSVSAENNLIKGRESLVAKNYEAATAYFAFVLSRFPLSKFTHDAELGLVEAEVEARPVIGSEYETAAYCTFIQHHPFHPLVLNGDLACRVNKLQKSPCVAKQTLPSKYCPQPAYCSERAASTRPECKS
jgi:hypothetical protein